MRRRSIIAGVLVGLVFVLAGPSAALADSSTSTNWSGYAVHRPGLSFRAISATWKQPVAHCDRPYPTFEATWVGIGGFKRTSNALEQIGTEIDCRGAGSSPRSAAWYEIVPAPSTRIALTVKAGDTMHASVTVVGRRVTLRLIDRTRHQTFSRTFTAAAVDVSSADWIVEAPSQCLGLSYCRTLPLTNFGKVAFTGAGATAKNGRHGSIASKLWDRTSITLAPSGQTYVAAGAAPGRARPSALSTGGTAFEVQYLPASSAPAPTVALAVRAAEAPPARIEPGGRRR